MSYPKNLSYAVSKLSGYSTQVVKVRPNGNDTASPNQVVSFDLPVNALVDLDSIRIVGKFTTTTTASFAQLKNAEGLIRSIQIESGGQMISQGCDGTHLLWNAFNDIMAGDKVTARKLYNVVSDITSAPTANNSSVDFYVNNLLGFLPSAKPQFMDMSLFPQGTIRINIRLNDLSPLVYTATTAGASWSLSGLYLLCRTVSIDDGLYYNVLAERLKTAPIEVPFTNIYSFNSGSLSANTSATLRFALASQSVDALIGFPVPTPADQQINSTIQNAPVYVRGVGAGVGTPSVQWSLNNVVHPSYGLMTEVDAFTESIASMGLLQDTVGAMSPLMDTATKWREHFFLSMYRLNHPDGDSDSRVISGLNYLGTSGIGEFRVDAGSGARTLWVFVMTTAVLKLGAGRTLAVTY